MLKKIRNFMLSFLFFIFLFPLPGYSSQGNGYTVKCDPSPVVHENNDGTSLINASFYLFNNGMRANDLEPGDFIIYDDNFPVQATIKAPSSTGKKVADIFFCLDISGSMGDEISAVKNNIKKFVNALQNANIDVKLGLITFGQASYPYLRVRNNGQFYNNVHDFINEVSKFRANGGIEEWYEAIAKASQLLASNGRQGANRIIILITDEPGDSTQTYPNVESAIKVVKNNSAKIYGISYSYIQTVVKAVNETHGKFYNIRNSFSDILNDISTDIQNTYSLSFISNDGPGIHTLKVEIVQNGNSCTSKFKIGANPVIKLTTKTSDAVKNGVKPNTGSFDIEAEIKDPDGTISKAEILLNGSSYEMSNLGADIYSYSVSGLNSVGNCVSFSIKALDNDGRVVKKGPWKICVSNSSPVIGTILPASYDYGKDINVRAEVSDPDNDQLNVRLRYREKGDAVWQNLKMNLNGNKFEATIPKESAGFKGIEIEVIAEDSNGAKSTKSQYLKVNKIPVKIINVTKLINTLDTGPFTVYAVVAGVDINNGGSVELEYSINGGNKSTEVMTIAVTGTNAPMQTNSNIYVAEIPSVNPGDKICYNVVASNPTETERSKEICFEVLQPVEPLSITPSSARICMGDNAVEFLAKGGYGTYKWESLSGSLSPTLGDKVKYTPTLTGFDKISVKDIKGFTATATIEVLPSLDITPDVDGKRFSPSSSIILTATGCEAPYKWKVEGAEKYTVSGDDNEQVNIELGSTPSTITVTLEDAKGRTKTVKFTNNGVLSLTPSGEINIDPGASQKFTVSGGQEPYTWKVVGGEVDNTTGVEVNYTAPNIPGVYHISVTDANGDYASTTIKVGEPLRVTPHAVRLMRGESAEFQVVSGTPPYKWEAEYGKLSSTIGEKVTYTPENKLGLYKITVYDNAGSLVNLTVEVYEGLTVTPANPTVELGKSLELTVSGGTGSYRWSAKRGSLSPLSGDKVTYTPPLDLGDGSDEVTVKDDSGNEAKITIKLVEEIQQINELKISPEEITINPGGTQVFKAINAKDPSKVKWTATSGDITSDGKYTAPEKSGIYTVTVVDILNGRKATAKVTVTNQLILTPTNATLGTGESKEFTVSGGASPYMWKIIGEGELSSYQGEKVTYTSSSKAGPVTLMVIDSRGISAKAEITVIGKLKVSPENVTLAPGMTQQFTATGGTGNISWIAEKGEIDSSGKYTAPQDIGTYIITAKDDAGNEATAKVTVGNVPVITPKKVWLDLNETATLEVVGGTPPYTWTTTAGDVNPKSGKSVTFTAPSVSQEVKITVEDSLGQKSEAIAYVDLPMQATKSEIYLEPQSSTKVAVTGGVPPFEWTASRGDLAKVKTVEAGINTYTADKIQGDATITVRDRKGNSTTIKVHIIKKFLVSPEIRYMKREETKTFTIQGGVAPYSAIIKSGDGDIEPANCNEEPCVFKFTSGKVSDQDVLIEFSDSSGQKYTAHAYVERKLRISFQSLKIPRGSKVKFRVTGGYGDYWAEATAGEVDIDPDTGKGTYNAPKTVGEVTLTVADAADQEITAKIEIVRSNPVISPLNAVLNSGETKTFMVSMGAGPYEWSFEGGSYKCMDEECSVIQITAPNKEGKYKLTVEDANGQTPEKSASIEVKLPLLVSPASYVVYKGEIPRLRVSALGGTPPYDFIVSDVEEISRGDDYIIVSPRTDVKEGTEYKVICRDATGETINTKIIVSRLPGDLNGDGKVDDSEMNLVIKSYLEGIPVNGIKIKDPSLVYKHIEAYENK